MSHKHHKKEHATPYLYQVIRKVHEGKYVYLHIEETSPAVGFVPPIKWGSFEMASEWHNGSPDYVTVKRLEHGKISTAAWMVGFDVAAKLVRKHGGEFVVDDGCQTPPTDVCDNSSDDNDFFTPSDDTYNKQLNVKLTEEDVREIECINRDFFEGEATNSMLGRVLLRKGIAFYKKLRENI